MIKLVMKPGMTADEVNRSLHSDEFKEWFSNMWEQAMLREHYKQLNVEPTKLHSSFDLKSLSTSHD
jgi:hypothetical protein